MVPRNNSNWIDKSRDFRVWFRPHPVNSTPVYYYRKLCLWSVIYGRGESVGITCIDPVAQLLPCCRKGGRNSISTNDAGDGKHPLTRPVQDRPINIGGKFVARFTIHNCTFLSYGRHLAAPQAWTIFTNGTKPSCLRTVC